MLVNGDLPKALEFFQEALTVEASCVEALYNLGLVYKKMNNLDAALDCFLKLHAILRNNAEVVYQVAHVYELLDDVPQAIEWFLTLVCFWGEGWGKG